jgi:hypothetical protein
MQLEMLSPSGLPPANFGPQASSEKGESISGPCGKPMGMMQDHSFGPGQGPYRGVGPSRVPRFDAVDDGEEFWVSDF